LGDEGRPAMASVARFAVSDAAFKSKVEAALEAARRVLGDARASLRYAGDVPHAYGDKFAVVAAAVGAAAASELAALRAAGLSDELLQKVLEWQRAGKTVTLQFDGATHCAPKGQRIRIEESPKVTECVTEERSGAFGFGGKTKERTVSVKREVKEWLWAVSAEWKLRIFTGAAPDDDSGECAMLAGRASEPVEHVTSNESPPRPKEKPLGPAQLNVTWLLRQVEKDLSIRFEIDRAAEGCHTPARNKQVAMAVDHMRDAAHFAKLLINRTKGVCELDPGQLRHAAGWAPPGDSQGFIGGSPVPGGVYVAVPAALALADDVTDTGSGVEGTTAAEDASTAVRVVLPLADSEDATSVPLMSNADMATLLGESMRSLDSLKTQVERKAAESPRPNGPCSAAEFWLGSCVGSFLSSVATSAICAVADVEGMLRKQVADAVGRTLTEKDFSDYMAFHCRSLFGPAYRPRPFCYAVRRPGHAPEGELSICSADDSSPVETMVASRFTGGEDAASVPPMHVKLSASARLAFTGDRYVHGIVRHGFSSSGALRLHLRARARQFSCFVLVAGTITAADELEPVAALLIRDKDDLDIPLTLETIPTQREFRDAIESLSPEQQDFCKSLRAMQLASTLFGVAVIQIKPQMERLLNLPPDALTKEIKLTRDLMTLFTKFQMPSDVISYGGNPEACAKDKLDAVRAQVSAMTEMVAEEKKAEVEEAMLQRRFEKGLAGGEEEAEEEANGAECGDPELMAASDTFYRSAPKGVRKGKMAKLAMAGRGLLGGDRAAPMAMAPMAMASGGYGSAPPPCTPVMPKPMQRSTCPAPPQAMRKAAPVQTESAASPVQQHAQPIAHVGGAGGSVAVGGTIDVHADVTVLPSRLDAACAGDEARAGALRATIIKPADAWTKISQPKLLGAKSTSTLRKGSEEEKSARAEAFDLLDALSRSGELCVREAELHVVLAATHCFDDTLMDTLVARNINPIAKVERSCVSVASVVHGGLEPAAMLPAAAAERLNIEGS